MKPLKKYGSLIVLSLLIIFSNWFISSQQRVEEYYSNGLYPYIALALRWTLGWIPFSIGDLLYCAVIVWLGLRSWKFLSHAWKRGFKQWREDLPSLFILVLNALTILAWTWLVFHALWGFNYYRKGMPEQFGLSAENPSKEELSKFAGYLLRETNRFAVETKVASPESALFFNQAELLRLGETGHPSMESNRPASSKVADEANHPPNPQPPSFKSSLFGVLGNYMGYGGYYNPFTGEAQINTHMPSFMLPFIAVHEKAHQLGYAKESEANFIGYLSAIDSGDSSLKYAANLEMFIYANNALRRLDSLGARKNLQSLSPIAIRDIRQYRAFVKKYQGPIDAFTTWFYTKFLRLNNQPEGMYSYNKGMLYVMRYINKKPA